MSRQIINVANIHVDIWPRGPLLNAFDAPYVVNRRG